MPVLADINGNVSPSLSFEIESGTFVRGSCGVEFKGDFYVYGSAQDGSYRQIAKVVDCSLKTIGTLPFDHYFGSCATTSNQVFLCFDMLSDAQTCYLTKEPTGQFSQVTKSGFQHRLMRIAANEGTFISSGFREVKFIPDTMLACGSWSPTTTDCEIYKINDDKWETIESYPFELGSQLLLLNSPYYTFLIFTNYPKQSKMDLPRSSYPLQLWLLHVWRINR